MTVDEMEAESWRYGPKLVMVVPLTSGRLAVCSPRRDIIAYCDTLEHAIHLTANYHELSRRIPSFASSVLGALNIEDLL